MQRCAIVTGSAGLIGRSVVRELSDRGWDVLAFCRGPKTSRLANVSPVPADLGGDGLARVLSGLGRKVDAVFHFGAQLPAPGVSNEAYARVNALATATLLDFAAATGVADFVYASTIGHIGSPRVLPVDETHPVAPEHPYFASKFCGELLCENARKTTGANVSSLRITSPYGPGMKGGTVLPLFASKALRGEPITVFGQGGRTQNFVYGPDVAKAAVALLGRPGGICNVAGPESISMLRLAEIISKYAPSPVRIGLSGTEDPLESQRWEVSSAQLREWTGYAPDTGAEAGIRRYMESLTGPDASGWWTGP